MEVIFAICAFACLYVYAGYPLLLKVVGMFSQRGIRKSSITPFLSIIIPVYNEEQVIEDKLNDLLETDYPPERREIIVVSDGSDDKTEQIVGRYKARGVQLIALPRIGKLNALNQAVSVAGGEIIVFTDADTELEHDALLRLVENFADPEVGGVGGVAKYRTSGNGDSSGRGEDLYWTYDKWVKRLETRTGSMVGADGQLYAIRKDLFVPVTEPAQADDFVISVQVVTQGYRLVLERSAIAYHDPKGSSQNEFARRIRVTNHSLRNLVYLKEALNPWRYGLFALQMISRGLRYLVPVLLIAILAINFFLLSESPIYAAMLSAQGLFYASAVAGSALRNSRVGKFKLFYGPFYFCLGNLGVLLGVISFFKGQRFVSWETIR